MLAMTGITIGSEREHLVRLLRMGYRVAIGREADGEREAPSRRGSWPRSSLQGPSSTRTCWTTSGGCWPRSI